MAVLAHALQVVGGRLSLYSRSSGLGFTEIWVATILIAVIYSIQAGRGEWADWLAEC
jgi:hypothetical protein